MRHDIEVARVRGAAGVVFGMVRPDATIDRERTARLVELARPMSVTFHKAFDQVRDPDEALDVLIDLGIDRVLTSGCCSTAMEGVEVLNRLVHRAGNRIAILAGGRLSLDDLGTILARTGVREVHIGSAVTRTMTSAMSRAPEDGSNLRWPGIDPARVRTIVEHIRGISDRHAGRQ
jgi:copper homeostasis protein